jgi:hypothetical protein
MSTVGGGRKQNKTKQKKERKKTKECFWGAKCG